MFMTSHAHKFNNVLIISLDCVRREALSCYPQRFPWRTRIFQEAYTPNIDKLCHDGITFKEAITQAPYTPAAHASLFTGLNPPSHGIRRYLGSTLNKNVRTLAEVLSQHGKHCGGIAAAQALNRDYGLSRGFHNYDDLQDVDSTAIRYIRSATEVTDKAISWMQTLDVDQQFFLFVHYFDAHNVPQQAQAGYRSRDPQNPRTPSMRDSVRDTLPNWLIRLIRPLDSIVRSIYFFTLNLIYSISDRFLSYFEAGRRYRYEGRRYMLKQTAKIDVQIGRLLDEMSRQGKLDNTLVIVLADHGDDFWEHGEPTHRHFLYDTTIVVPLIIYPRTNQVKFINQQARLIDLYPTILSNMGIDDGNEIDGEDLSKMINLSRGDNLSNGPRKAYAETVYETIDQDSDRSAIETCFAALRDYPWKLIWDRQEDTYELYRLDTDPHEKNNLAEIYPEQRRLMQSELKELAKEMPVEAEIVEQEVVDRLKALGYL